MAANNMQPTDWATYYTNNHADGGAIQNLFNLEDDELTDISKGHLDNGTGLTTTIAGSGEANIILLPSVHKGSVEILHHGFASSLHLGGMIGLAFVHGNLSGSNFKVFRPDAAVEKIGASTRATTRAVPGGINSPKPESYFGISKEEEFGKLPPEDCTDLKDQPNHMFVHPKHFIRMNGPRTKQASSFAMSIIKELNDRHDEAADNAQARTAVEKEKDEVGPLLAFLWAAETGALTGVTLSDTPESTQINQRCERIRAKIRGDAPGAPGGPAPNGPTGTDATSLAVAAQTLTLVMTANEKTRVEEREEDKSSKSLIKSLGPQQQGLFMDLATDHMGTPPAMSQFMKDVIKEKSPVKATQLIVAQMRRWKGIVSLASLHRFLASGFLSQESNLSEPGGLTGFMFFPRSEMSAGPSGTSRDKQRIRDYFDLPIEEDCVDYYVKKEYFIPSNVSQLEIVLTAWRDLIELITVKNSIATAGLHIFLKSFEDLYQILEEMFRVVPNFGLLLILSLDRHLQNFYDMVSEMDDVTAASPYERGYLTRRADVLIQELEEHKPPSIIIPACLLTPSSKRIQERSTNEAEPHSSDQPTGDKGSAKAPRDPQVPAKNPEVEPAWSLPSGKSFDKFFPRNSPNLGGWPKLKDPRHSNERNMCVRYQVLGQCKSRCPLAHLEKSKMSSKEEVEVSTRFRKVLQDA